MGDGLQSRTENISPTYPWEVVLNNTGMECLLVRNNETKNSADYNESHNQYNKKDETFRVCGSLIFSGFGTARVGWAVIFTLMAMKV